MHGVAATSDTSAAYQRALTLHRDGRLDQAAELYHEVLAGEPAHFGALHLLGVVHGQRGHYALALELIEQAIRVDARVAAAHVHLGKPGTRSACSTMPSRAATRHWRSHPATGWP